MMSSPSVKLAVVDADGFAVAKARGLRRSSLGEEREAGVGGSDLLRRPAPALCFKSVFFRSSLGSRTVYSLAISFLGVQVVGGTCMVMSPKSVGRWRPLHRAGFVGVNDGVSLVRREVIGAVLGDEPSKPLPHVEDAKLRPDPSDRWTRGVPVSPTMHALLV